MSGNNFLVSVLIPSYNHEKYIQNTIKSIINQTYQNIELIILDDGSKDNTFQKMNEMYEKCQKRFSNVIFKTKQNEGTTKTFNKLLDMALGEYIYIIASDDIAKENAIEKEIEFLSKNKDYGLCVGDNEIIDFENKVCYWDKNRKLVYEKQKAKYLTFGDYLKQSRKDVDFNSVNFGRYDTLAFGNYIPNGYLIKKEVFDKIGYFTFDAPLEDYWLMLQISKYYKMKFLDEILFQYRWHDTNSAKNTKRMDLFFNKTIEYEKQILKNIDKNVVLKPVIDFINQGYLFETKGIKNIFQIEIYKKFNQKIKKIKIFNKNIFSYSKVH